MQPTDANIAMGMAPVLLGLAVIMLPCAVPWLVRRFWRDASADAETEADAFDPDAALARYMARRPEGSAVLADTVVALSDFGRKSTS